MKRVISCIRCEKCFIHTPPGFFSEPEYHCSDRNGVVVLESDGCTLGVPGNPGVAVTDYEIELGESAAVRGW